MNFKELGLCPPLLKNVQKSGYTEPTPIQRETIPLVLQGKDVLGCAQTGTGKTAAFALPMLQRLKETPPRKDAKVIRALILSPTRELAQQTYDNFEMYGRGFGLTPCVLFGGVSQVGQTEALHRGADIVVACPGRLLDLMGQGLIRLEDLEIFVLDEADRMLDMGFIHDVRRIMAALPAKRQTLLFSATMPPEVEKLAMDLLKEPASVKVDPVTSTVEAIDQCLYYVDKPNKRRLLAWLLKNEDLENALVFSRTKHGVDRIVRELKREGIDAVGIHGDKSQGARQSALNRFRGGQSRVMVATDIAARGLDIVGLSHVINFDLPNAPESYIHRIGRTGRAGRSGKAISFCCIDEVKQLGQIEKLIGKRLHEEKSAWPMENFTPSPPKTPGERPKKLNMQGEPMPQRKPAAPQASGNGKCAAAADRKPESVRTDRGPEAGRGDRKAEAGRGERKAEAGGRERKENGRDNRPRRENAGAKQPERIPETGRDPGRKDKTRMIGCKGTPVRIPEKTPLFADEKPDVQSIIREGMPAGRGGNLLKEETRPRMPDRPAQPIGEGTPLHTGETDWEAFFERKYRAAKEAAAPQKTDRPAVTGQVVRRINHKGK